ncbi:putative ABC transport system permease protein [Paenibacillus turicensis]|uniref:ABC transport system permease protein n=1 Tax=Paenibacillus turicensis TaxID=160487 RepID=A0ABS4FRH7_9BACL|nr:ABC transporter permease [Paenibacillus turicensis]MBP1905181.1 putative ABC transport system permease protein [Paenibacillus turicensis]
MNIFNKVTLQGMKKSRTRTIVTIIGVMLAAAMITGVATFATSLQDYMVKGAIINYGNWHVQLVDVDTSFIQQQGLNNRIESTATFDNVGYAQLEGGKNANKPYLFIAGFSPKTFAHVPINLLSGRMPQNSGEIIVPAHLSTNAGVKLSVGETLSLEVGNRMEGNKRLNQHDPYISGKKEGTTKEILKPNTEKRYTVVGIFQRTKFEETSAPGYTVITQADSQEKVESHSLFVTLKNPRDVKGYVSDVAYGKAYVYNENVLRFMGITNNDSLFKMLLYMLGAIVLAIIMVGSIFMIYNSFTISLNERTRQFGILSSVGATPKQLRNSVLFEGFCIGVIGIPLGIIVGIGSMGLVISAVTSNFGNMLYENVPLTLKISLPAIVVAAVVSMVTILISAYIPARKAANTPVMESIRQTNEVKVESKAVRTSKLAQRIYGLEGTLALKNFKRNKKRYRSIVLSLILSVVLFISASSFVTDMKMTSERATVFTTYDIGVATPDIKDNEMLALFDKLKTVEGVYESSYHVLMKYSLFAKPSDLSDYCWQETGENQNKDKVNLSTSIQFIDDNTYAAIVKKVGLPEKEYSGEKAKLIAVAKVEIPEQENRTMEVGEIPDLFKPSSISVSVAPEVEGKAKVEEEQVINLTFVNTVPPDSLPIVDAKLSKVPYTLTILAPYSLKERFETPSSHVAVKGMTFLSKEATKSVNKMEPIIKGAAMTGEYKLYNMHQMLDESRNFIFITNVFAYTFIIMISLIAIANVFNTISTNIKLRRRELAMLRSVGMSERSFQKMMNFECAFYGLRALLIGLPVAILCSWLIYKGLFVAGADNIDYIFPWESIGISVFSVLFIVFITMLYAISKIKKENIIDALRDDMT